MTTLEALTDWYRARQLRVVAGAERLAATAWRDVNPADLSGWASRMPGMVAMVQAGMIASASGASEYVAGALAMQGVTEPVPNVVPAAFSMSAADGRPLGSLLYMPALNTQARMDVTAASASQAMRGGLSDLIMIVATEVADAGRQAVAAAAVASKRVTRYRRVPGPVACARCAILADRVYSTYEAASFERHPRCMCTAVPVTDSRAAKFDAHKYFDGLTKVQQDRVFTTAGAQAIRDGADMSKVVNARRGVSPIGWRGGSGTGWTTLEGASRSGVYRTSTVAGRAGKPRLTTEAIYRLSATRDEAVSMLRDYGYLA